MKHTIAKLLSLATIGLVLCIIGWKAGEFFWLLELFSHFVPHYAAISLGLAVLLLLFGKRKMALVAVLVCAVCAYAIFPLYRTPEVEKGKEIRILQWNVLYLDRYQDKKAAWLKKQAKNADIIVLQEFTDKWLPTTEALRKEYPYQQVYVPVTGGYDYRGAAILSRYPGSIFALKDEQTDTPYLRMEVTIKDKGDLVLYAIHPPPPMSAWAAAQRNTNFMTVAFAMAKETASYKVIVGDFNCTRYSHWFDAMAGIAGLRDSYEGFGLHTTWPINLPFFMGIAIDQMLISDSITVASKQPHDYLYSDHKPVFTKLALK